MAAVAEGTELEAEPEAEPEAEVPGEDPEADRGALMDVLVDAAGRPEPPPAAEDPWPGEPLDDRFDSPAAAARLAWARKADAVASPDIDEELRLLAPDEALDEAPEEVAPGPLEEAAPAAPLGGTDVPRALAGTARLLDDGRTGGPPRLLDDGRIGGPLRLLDDGRIGGPASPAPGLALPPTGRLPAGSPASGRLDLAALESGVRPDVGAGAPG